MKTNRRDIEVIVKLIDYTRNKKIQWVKYSNKVLVLNKFTEPFKAYLSKDPLDWVYLAGFKDRYFQFYKTNSPIQNYELQLSSQFSMDVEKIFDYSVSMKDLYLAIKEQEGGINSFLDDFLNA